MGVIHVNPQGPGGNSDPQSAAHAIREAFGRMGDERRRDGRADCRRPYLRQGHGAADPSLHVGVEPEGGDIEAQGFGWANSYGAGNSGDTITSGLEGAWTMNPAAWTHNFLENLYGYEWEQTRSPGGATQWRPAGGAASDLVSDAHDPSQRHAPMMLTTDLALKVDPAYREITSRWLDDPEEFEGAFARAWFKLTHRDLGPTSRYLGDLAPDREFVWQDPVPEVDHALIDAQDAAALKAGILDAGLSTAELVRTAWASASTFRGTDMRGGANGTRIRLAPQKDWAAKLNLTVPEMAVLVGGMRVLDANAGGAAHGVFTDSSRHAEQRLLRQPDRHVDAVDPVVERGPLRGPRSRHGRAQMDGHAGRPDFRLQLRAARGRRVLRGRRRAGRLRARLRRGLGQGDDPGPLRLALMSQRRSFTEK